MLASVPATGAPVGAGDVVLYTALPQEFATTFPEAFMKRHPQVRIRVLRAGASEIERRLHAEIETGGIRADLVSLADQPIFLKLRRLCQLQQYRSPEARHIVPWLREPSGFFAPTRVSNVVIVVNTTLIPVHAAPKRWADLPKYARTAAMPNPQYSGTFDVVVAALVQEYGWAWFERARKEGLLVLRSNSDVGRALTSREVGVAMMLDVIAYDLIRDGAPLAWCGLRRAVSFPSPSRSPRRRRTSPAHAFVDHSSKEGQQAIAARWVHVRRRARQGSLRVSDIKAIRLSFEHVSRLQPRGEVEEILPVAGVAPQPTGWRQTGLRARRCRTFRRHDLRAPSRRAQDRHLARTSHDARRPTRVQSPSRTPCSAGPVHPQR
jgi:iron(III) transport system substrate-binding protein